MKYRTVHRNRYKDYMIHLLEQVDCKKDLNIFKNNFQTLQKVEGLEIILTTSKGKEAQG